MAGEDFRSPDHQQRPLWQPWFNQSEEESLRRSPASQHDALLSADHREFAAKELPTKSRKDRRRKEAQHDVISKSKHHPRRDIQVPQEENDAPLDMTTGRRDLHFDFTTKPPSYAQSIAANARPSVITCATLGRGGPGSAGSSTGERSQRREVVSGMCDPVIDEHFRRSLGDRYSHLFGSSASTEEENNSSMASPASLDNKSPTVSVTGFSVDDHFAKALGETWLKLQNDEGKQKEKADSKPGSPLTTKQRHELLLT